ncbi:hypothetical protein SORBI_3007G030501 [Sorghum bicolor]|uniref:Uncharacterized protein n=1 Tax=Sorghum bicolor TaxID=4558 RepID=A0A1Z5R7V1_SORBI|nr:hypothetical protein SORBI_3007G030501 [Sorghum bicolor]
MHCMRALLAYARTCKLQLRRRRLRRRRPRVDAVVSGDHPVLVPAREPCALEPKRVADHTLDAVRHVEARRAAATAAGGHRREDPDLVPRRRVHEEEDGVEPLVSPHRGSMEHGAAGPDGRRRDLAGDLGEQRAEPQQVRLPAGGALRADHQVAAGELALHDPAVPAAVARQPDRRDRRDQLREAREAVRHGGHLPAQHRREDHRVHQRLVVAGEQCASPWSRRLRCSAEAAAYPEARGRGEEEAGAVGEEAEEEARHGEEHAERDPQEDGEAHERVRPAHEAAVVEDQRPQVLAPRQRRRRRLLRRGHHAALLANLQKRRLPVPAGGGAVESHVDDPVAPKNGHQSTQAPVTATHDARRGYQSAGEPAPSDHPQLGADDADVGAEVLPDERLHDEPGQARPERGAPEVGQEELGQRGARHRRHVGDAEEEVWEEAAGDEQRAFQLGGDAGAPVVRSSGHGRGLQWVDRVSVSLGYYSRKS